MLKNLLTPFKKNKLIQTNYNLNTKREIKMRYQNTINLFQQNIFIQQVNININIYPIINTMLKDLNIAFSEFKTACEFSNEAEVREKALSVLARYRSILDNKRDFYQAIPNNYIHMNNYNELNKNQLLH